MFFQRNDNKTYGETRIGRQLAAIKKIRHPTCLRAPSASSPSPL